MSALFAALFDDHTAAERVRTALVNEGFPTDRVELTSAAEPGQAAIGPADRHVERLQDYFVQFFDRDDEQSAVRTFVDGVKAGKASIIVHPRGDIETRQALQILRNAQPAQLREHDIEKQFMERAASPANESVVERVIPDALTAPKK